MSISTAKKSKWFRDRCELGCQICGVKFSGRKNNGLVFSHIIEDGPLKKENVLALCPNCEDSFDKTLKPALYEAITKHAGGKVPKVWGKSE